LGMSFFLLICKNSLYILDINLLFDMYFQLFWACGLTFYFLCCFLIRKHSHF
jgi:hypothetical protein